MAANSAPSPSPYFTPPRLAGLGLAALVLGLSLSGSLRRLSPGILESTRAMSAMLALALLPALYYAYALARQKPAPLLRGAAAPWAVFLLAHLAVELCGGGGSTLSPAYALVFACLAAFAAPLSLGILLALALGLEARHAGLSWDALAPLWGSLAGLAFRARDASPRLEVEAQPAPAPAQRVEGELADPDETLPDFDAQGFVDQGITKLMDLAFHAHPHWNSLILLWREGEGMRLRDSRVRQGRIVRELEVQRGDGILGLVLKEGRRHSVDDLALSAAQAIPYYVEGEKPAKAILATLVEDEGEPLALLAADKAEPAAWSPDEINSVENLGQQIASQFQNARFFEKSMSRGRQLSKLYGLSKELAADLDRERLLARMEELLFSLLSFDTWYLALREEGEEGLKIASSRGYIPDFVASHRIDDKTTLGSWGLGSGNPLVYNAGRSGAAIPAFLLEGMQAPCETFLLVPFMLKGKVLGLLKLDRQSHSGFSAQEKEAAMIFAQQFSVTLEHARLYSLHQKLATTDGLTGLYNHRYFQERLALELDQAARTNKPLSLALTDIDFFKKFNDTFGHQEGDNVLKKCASMVKANVRQGKDIVCRYGGEEFVVILPECDLVEAREVMDRVRETSARDLIGGSGPEARAIHLSIGLCSFPLGAKEQREIIHLADSALYKAKQSGRNRVCSFKDLP